MPADYVPCLYFRSVTEHTAFQQYVVEHRKFFAERLGCNCSVYSTFGGPDENLEIHVGEVHIFDVGVALGMRSPLARPLRVFLYPTPVRRNCLLDLRGKNSRVAQGLRAVQQDKRERCRNSGNDDPMSPVPRSLSTWCRGFWQG